ncbi:hypothetical protein ISG33_11685 [Glaciecola sp. MH2013]|uniref:hypothetical protein n=1 Tax=Glaciecola sp. MH2013 TaxID=2785524 RepID=UPI00189CEADD|nr:hypothetical protein [Glaciecola sp. MH2013]MBF7074060.1 hypothetical protein [Glaciecola sp. MH2013]
MSSTLKASLFFIALLAGLTWAFSFLYEQDTSGVSRTDNGLIKYYGQIDEARVDEFKRLYQRGDRLEIRSTGGDLYAGMEMGKFISEQKIPLEVKDYCISSCANYVFLASPRKVLNERALVIFHGGPKQRNFLAQLERAYTEDNPAGTSYGRESYEAVVSVSEANRRARYANRYNSGGNRCKEGLIRNMFGDCTRPSEAAKQRYNHLVKLEEDLYSSIDPFMDINIPYYGQLGRYIDTYQSYEFFGFYYDLESLARLGVKGIELKSGEWAPERNPLFKDVYLVEM